MFKKFSVRMRAVCGEVSSDGPHPDSKSKNARKRTRNGMVAPERSSICETVIEPKNFAVPGVDFDLDGLTAVLAVFDHSLPPFEETDRDGRVLEARRAAECEHFLHG